MPAVLNSSDLDRVLALPRRRDVDPELREAWARAWTWALLTDHGKRELLKVEAMPEPARSEEFRRRGLRGEPLLLSYEQARSLAEAREYGLFMSGGVGVGKTLLTFLLPYVLLAPPGTAAVFVPGGLVVETVEKFGKLALLWEGTGPVVESYDKISHPNHIGYLCSCHACIGETKPGEYFANRRYKTVIWDEMDLLRDRKSTRTRRMLTYIFKHANEVRAFGMTGTPIRDDLDQMAHLMKACLRFGSPLPLIQSTLDEWCQALNFSPEGQPNDVGALRRFCPGVANPTAEQVLEALGNWIAETPGIIITLGQSCDTPIHVRCLRVEAPELDADFHNFRKLGITPDGWDVGDPLTAFAHGTELSCDFYYRWDPRPPQEWIDARSDAFKFIREMHGTRVNGRVLDSAEVVKRAYPEAPELTHWREVEPTFTPNSVPVLRGYSVFNAAVEWIRLNSPALIWVQHQFVGQMLAHLTGLSFYGNGGICVAGPRKGSRVAQHPHDQSAIISVDGNRRGRNLQHYYRALVVGPPQAETDWEQAIFGRMHRQGQNKPVFIDVVVTSAENVRALEVALGKAQWGQILMKRPQKIALASIDWGDALRSVPYHHPSRARWTLPSR